MIQAVYADLGFLLRDLPLFFAAAFPLFDFLLSGSLLPLLLLQLPQTLLILTLLLLTLLLLQTLPVFTLCKKANTLDIFKVKNFGTVVGLC